MKNTKRIHNNDRILNANKPFLITVSIIFALYSITFIFPFIWLIINSVKDRIDFIESPMGLPQTFHFDNYLTMFVDFNLPEMFGNTLLMCTVIPTVGLLITNGVAYAVAKYNFKLKGVCYAIAMVNVYVSIAGTLPTTFRMMGDLQLLDTFWGLLFMGSSGLNFQFLLLHGIYLNIPRDYKEAAQIDGAGHWRIYMQVYFPQVLPTTISLWILAFIGQWNNFTSPYLFWQSHKTLATGLNEISANIAAGSSAYAMQYPKLFAAMLITIIPVVLIFIFLQRPINKMSMSSGGGVKG